MPRLPVPGSDDGQWGEILNAFLRVVHNDDGSLKTPSIPLSDKGSAGGVAELDGGGKVATSQLPAAALAGDATSTDKGVLRLTGDLGGTAASPTVPGLASKANASDVVLRTNNLSDLDNFTTTRQNLGLEIGVDVQAWDSTLDVWSGKAVPSGTVVGTSDAQTLTNKTLTSPVISNPTGLSKDDVALSNVDNTADADKPVSTAAQTALDLKENLSNKSTSTSLGTSDTLYPSQNAVKSYVDSTTGSYVPLSGGTMTGGLTLTSAATAGLVQYNTADQTTNFERIRGIWASNAYYLGHEWAGSGSSRTLNVGVAAAVGNTLASGSGRFISIKPTIPFYSLNIGSTGLTGNIFDYSGSTLAASSSTQTAFAINPTINESSTAGYTMLAINPAITAIGSGTNYLIDAQTASSPRFQISANSGAPNQGLVSAPNGAGDVAFAIQNNATTASETASLLFYTTTNTASAFGRVRTTRVDGANSRVSIAAMNTSALVNHLQMYGDTGLMSLGAGSTPANGLVTIGSDTTSVSGGLYFGTDTTLYRFGTSVLGTNSRFLVNASSTGAIGLSVRTTGNANDRLQILGSGTLQFGDGTAIPDTTLYRSAADTLRTDDNLIVAGAGSVAGSVVTVDSTQSLSNKRLTPRVTSITSSATPTINTDNCDAVTITAQAAAITSMTSGLSGTPVNFQKLMIRIRDDGTARSITWGASFASRGVSLPTTTVISKVLTVGLIYNTVTSTWDCVAVAQEA